MAKKSEDSRCYRVRIDSRRFDSHEEEEEEEEEDARIDSYQNIRKYTFFYISLHVYRKK